MAYLYCENDLAKKITAFENQDWSKFPDEYVKTSIGILKKECVCDLCNKKIEIGTSGLLVQYCQNENSDQIEKTLFSSFTVNIYPHKNVSDDDYSPLTISEVTESSLRHLLNEFE